MFKKVLASLLFLSLLFLVFAGGKKETVEREVAQRESWQESMPIEDKKPGKYNILVTAEDQGGNITVTGPYNVFIDPASDLPITGITNPPPEMRVPGNLNIVGTCIDDDAVDHVELFFDDDDTKPAKAEGKEFWSYYLDTTKLLEGPHKITVVGVDINGVRGNPVTVIWNLDRYQPVTEIQNYTLGTLLSGKVNFNGLVTDGNGIKELTYSIDNGENFQPIKMNFNKKEQKWTFDLSIDTKKLVDGPQVCWFRAIDLQGSVGTSSFLFFVDNTNPEVKLYSPAEEEQVNGIFSIAGVASDIIGIEKLSWTLGKETGDFELTPGNPYWTHEFNILGKTEKTQELSISATDKVGNTTVFKRKLSVNFEADLPVVNLVSPYYEPVKGDKVGVLIDDELFLRGSVLDDDGVAEVIWKIDSGDEHSILTQGVFYSDLKAILAEFPTVGFHNLYVYAIDIHGTKGLTVTIPFTVKGPIPSFDTPVIKTKLGGKPVEEPYTQGIVVHPESSAILALNITSPAGLNKYSWSFNGIDAGEVVLKSVKGVTKAEIPLENIPWGPVQIVINTEDIYGRVSTSSYFIYEKNLTKTRDKDSIIAKSEIIFDDNRIAPDGSIALEKGDTLYGYFKGGKAVRAEIIPNDQVAKVTLRNNSIIVTSLGKPGKSQPAVIQITTDKDLVYNSREFQFIVKEPIPQLKLDQHDVLDGFSSVTISGEVYSEYEGLETGYRILNSADNIPGYTKIEYIVEEPEEEPVDSEAVEGTDNKEKEKQENKDVPEEEIPEETVLEEELPEKFLITIPTSEISEGISVVEIYTKTAGSDKNIKTIFINKTSPLPLPDPNNPKAKAPVAAPPVFTWINGENLYYTVYYQNTMDLTSVSLGKKILENGVDGVELSAIAGIIPYSVISAGVTPIEVKVADFKKKAITGKYTHTKEGQASITFDTINNIPYIYGMDVNLPKIGTKIQDAVVHLLIKADLPITSMSYSIGDFQQGKLTPKKIMGEDKKEIPGEFECTIPLKDIPAEITDIKVTMEINKTQTFTTDAVISVLRDPPEAGVVDIESVIWTQDIVPNKLNNTYIVSRVQKIIGYVNVSAPYQVELMNPNSDLFVNTDGQIVTITANLEGLYEDVSLLITDSEGVQYTTDPIIILCDSAEPELKVNSPIEQSWLQNELKLEVEASDANDLNSVEYSLDNGSTWRKIQKALVDGETTQDNLYSSIIELNGSSEGLVPLNIRVTDTAYKTIEKRFSLFKDVTPPTVETIVPAVGDVVNGETLIGLKVRDNGRVVSGWYVLPAKEAVKATEATETTPALAAVQGREEIRNELELMSMVSCVVGTVEKPLENDIIMSFVDASGNVNNYSKKDYTINAESDKPIVEIHLPDENAIVITDFVVSGIVYDDDGESRIYYKIDDGEFIALPGYGTSYSIPLELHSLTDNEHKITVYAEDMFGIKGDEVVRNIRVSLEEPKGAVNTPTFEDTVKGRVELTGVTSDKNGIKLVQVSVDNGSTWHDVLGTEEWSYEFDTRVIKDGTHVVFLRVWDNYGVQGLYSSLINVDNTAPEINLELPYDDSYHATGVVFLSGQTTDNIGLNKLYLKIRNMDPEQPAIPERIANQVLKVEEIINQGIDVKQLPDGFYNIEISGEDAAGNITRVSRNIRLDTERPAAELNLLYPMNGEHVQGVFNIYGSVASEYKIQSISLYVDGVEKGIAEVSPTEYFKFTLSPEVLSAGVHAYSVRTTLENDKVIYSKEQYLTYSPIGPWITIDTLAMGDFAIDRPYLAGETGYSLSELEALTLKDKKASKYEKDKIKEKTVDHVEISFDNGKTFTSIGKKAKWRYRIENQDIMEGYHFMVVRAIMKNGDTAVTRTIIQIDKTKPQIKLISPGEGGRYNETIEFAGLASDNVVLKSLKLSLRSGDKASYEVPSFIQGLYLDTHVWGASLFDVGAGLTFFEDNVKVQFQYGMFTQEQRNIFDPNQKPLRYGGHIFGLKLLANLGYVPFSYFFGPDFNWLAASFATGANFSWFSESQSKKPQFLSAFLMQIEFPRISMEKRDFLKTFSFYTELQVWLIPTDVDTKGINPLVPQISFGLRMNVF